MALAKKAAQAAQIAMVNPVQSIQNAMPCAVKNITDKLTGDVANLLAEFTIMLIILQIVLVINL